MRAEIERIVRLAVEQLEDWGEELRVRHSLDESVAGILGQLHSWLTAQHEGDRCPCGKLAEGDAGQRAARLRTCLNYHHLCRWNPAGAALFSAADSDQLLAVFDRLQAPNPRLRTIDEWLRAELPLERNETALVRRFNELLCGPSIHDGQRFRGMKLSKEVESLLKKENPQGEAIQWLNRRLLEDAYPADLRRALKKEDLSAFLRKAILGTRDTIMAAALKQGMLGHILRTDLGFVCKPVAVWDCDQHHRFTKECIKDLDALRNHLAPNPLSADLVVHNGSLLDPACFHKLEKGRNQALVELVVKAAQGLKVEKLDARLSQLDAELLAEVLNYLLDDRALRAGLLRALRPAESDCRGGTEPDRMTVVKAIHDAFPRKVLDGRWRGSYVDRCRAAGCDREFNCKAHQKRSQPLWFFAGSGTDFTARGFHKCSKEGCANNFALEFKTCPLCLGVPTKRSSTLYVFGGTSAGGAVSGVNQTVPPSFGVDLRGLSDDEALAALFVHAKADLLRACVKKGVGQEVFDLLSYAFGEYRARSREAERAEERSAELRAIALARAARQQDVTKRFWGWVEGMAGLAAPPDAQALADLAWVAQNNELPGLSALLAGLAAAGAGGGIPPAKLLADAVRRGTQIENELATSIRTELDGAQPSLDEAARKRAEADRAIGELRECAAEPECGTCAARLAATAPACPSKKTRGCPWLDFHESGKVGTLDAGHLEGWRLGEWRLEAWRKAGHDALVKWWPDVKAVFSAVITRSAQEEPVARDTSQPEDSDQRLY